MLNKTALILCMFMFFVTGCATKAPPSSSGSLPTPSEVTTQGQKINISFYGEGDGFDGKKTASGEMFDANKLTAAHRTFPFGTKLLLTNPTNGRKVEVRVNDRGPFASGRTLDVSPAAAKQLGITDKGVCSVAMEKRE